VEGESQRKHATEGKKATDPRETGRPLSRLERKDTLIEGEKEGSRSDFKEKHPNLGGGKVVRRSRKVTKACKNQIK